MLVRSLLAALTVAAASLMVGCAEEPVAEEERGETTSHATSSDDSAFLSQLETRANRCETFSAAELERLDAMIPMPFSFNAEIYGHVSCTWSANAGLVSASVTMEDRAGYSLNDGVFKEHANGVSTALEFKVKVVDASVSVGTEKTVRSSERVAYQEGSSTSIGVGVARDLKLVKVSADASYDLQSGTASISAGAGIPIPISINDCKGSQSVGVKLTLSVAGVEYDPRAVAASRVIDLEIQNRQAVHPETRLEYKNEPEVLREKCCDYWNKKRSGC